MRPGIADPDAGAMIEERHPARYYDGKSATGRDVAFRFRSGTLDILDAAGTPLAQWPLAAVKLRGNLRDDAAVIVESILSPAGRLRIEDAHAAEALTTRLPRAARTDRFQPRRVAGWTAVGLAFVGLLALGVHFLPRYAAPLLPFEAKRSLGLSVVNALFDGGSRCTGDATYPLQQMGERLRRTAGIEHPLVVIVINNPMVNAFAAPGGVVVVTRGLIAAAEGPDEVAGVLAHEIGHVAHDHATQGMLRNIGIDALLKLLTGGSDLEKLAGPGGLLAFLSYSRAAEEEADATAVEILDGAGLRTGGLGRFFARLEAREDGRHLLPTWLSTHPPTEARRLATMHDDAGMRSAALGPEGWRRLQSVCGSDPAAAPNGSKGGAG